MEVLRPGAKDGTGVDLPDVVWCLVQTRCDPLFGSWEAHGSGSGQAQASGRRWERKDVGRVCLLLDKGGILKKNLVIHGPRTRPGLEAAFPFQRKPEQTWPCVWWKWSQTGQHIRDADPAAGHLRHVHAISDGFVSSTT